jgi:hypothetical protein
MVFPLLSLEFIGRMQKELSLTASAIYESVLAIAERVNRKVGILRLHAQASNLLGQIEAAYGDLGRRVAVAIPPRPSPVHEPVVISFPELGRVLAQTTERIRRFKEALLQVDAKIRELKMEAIHEDLLTLQRELGLRSAAIERVVVMQGAPAVGNSLSELALPPSVCPVTIFRGPFLVTPSDTVRLRPDDVVILLGLRADLDRIGSVFGPARTAKSA